MIDAGGVRKPLDMHLGHHHSALRSILAALGRILRARRLFLGEGGFRPATSTVPPASGEGSPQGLE